MNKTLFLGAVLIAMTGGSAGVNAENADILPTGKTYTVNGVSFTMITIPAVTDGTLGYGEYNVNPAHTVSLPAYWIGGIDTDIYNAALPVRLFYTPDFHAGSLGLCLACRLSFLHLSNRLSYRNKKNTARLVSDIEFAETLPQKNYKENQQSYEDTYDQYHTRIPALSCKR